MATSTTGPSSPKGRGRVLSHDFIHDDDDGDNVFVKDTQTAEVIRILQQERLIPAEFIEREVNFFYEKLGIEHLFFKGRLSTPQKLAQFIEAIYGAKVLAHTRGGRPEIVLEHATENGGIFLASSNPGVAGQGAGKSFENKIDTLFLNESKDNNQFHVESYRAVANDKDDVFDENSKDEDQSVAQMRCYFVEKCEFHNALVSHDAHESNLEKISSIQFLKSATENTMDVYQGIMKQAASRTGPVSAVYTYEGCSERRMVIGYRTSTKGFFHSFTGLYHFYDLYSTRKFVEQFSNGITIMSVYLQQLEDSNKPDIDTCLASIRREISMLFTIPNTIFNTLFEKKVLSLSECAFATCGLRFAEHFLNRLGSDYEQLTSIMTADNEDHQRLLARIKRRLRMDTFSVDYIVKVLQTYPGLIQAFYAHFARSHRPSFNVASESSAPFSMIPRSASTLRILDAPAMSTSDLLEHARRTTTNQNEYMVFEALYTLSSATLKTNFFQPTKVALAFRLDPHFLPRSEYPDAPFGLFFVVSREFRGFHIRFADVARGGIRVIRSSNMEMFQRNVSSLFDETYNLANTQMRKNKDIPESGSKGTILLEHDYQGKEVPEIAFKKFVDGILDLLLVGSSPGVKDTLVDLYKQEEILYFGPDEGTADFMNWASMHARERGAKFWKAFTTGRGNEVGGIPHDTYGMTTRSVHQYVLGVLGKKGLTESECTKVQTGGPDGDLGSNEIKLSNDRTVAVVDGSGVLYDPNGIDRDELQRLAEGRLMVRHFNMDKLQVKRKVAASAAATPADQNSDEFGLSSVPVLDEYEEETGAYRVLIEDRDVRLPSGELVENGEFFRNGYHLRQDISATMFVPCGGRPNAVDMNNVKCMFDENKKPRFEFIVEGANLFFTEEARLSLHKAGVPVFKDASTNKGGVTSSSLEVLAALALDDADYQEHMCRPKEAKDVPAFYAKYVKCVQDKIEENARLEFEVLWREHNRTKLPLCTISNRLSTAIVSLSADMMKSSTLFERESLRRAVLTAYCPSVLVETFGLDKIASNVPETYMRAIFCKYLSSRFVYQAGLEFSPFSFFDFLTDLQAKYS